MDPLSSAITSLLNAIQGPSQGVSAPPLPVLMALVGQDVSMLLLGPSADGGVTLGLPSGQTVTAQGQMPYPEGTRLLVRVQAGSGTDAPVRLQTLRAAPPAQPAILAPLYQGEATTLLAGLAQPEPAPGLAPLVELFHLLSGGSAPSLPPAAQVQTALDGLPAPALASLKGLLDLPPSASLEDLGSALAAWAAAGGSRGSAPAGAQGPGPDLLQRFQGALDRHPDVPVAQANALGSWFKALLAAPEGRPAQAAHGADGPARMLQTLLEGRPGAPPSAPETWETWMKGSIRALSDPAVSPQGAAFHAAQAKDGTAFFELPLPWAPQHPLQMWVESDRQPRDQGGKGGQETRRVLLGLSFTNLGETRLGLAQSPGQLQVRVWAEHPERLAADVEGITRELEDLGSRVDLRVLRLTAEPGGAIPSVRGLATGSTLEALG